MKNVSLVGVVVFSLVLGAVDIPSANEPLIVPAGETLVVQDGNVDAFLKVKSVHLADAASKLVFDNVTKTPLALAMPFTGQGVVRMHGQRHTDTVIFKADNAAFKGSFSISNRHVRVQSVTGLGVGCPVAYTNIMDQITSCLSFEAPGEYDVPVALCSGAHYGIVYANEGVINKGTITLSHNSALYGPGTHAGDIVTECGIYVASRINILPGATLTSLSAGSVYMDGGVLNTFGCRFEGIGGFNIYRGTAKMLAENLFPDTVRLQLGVGYARSGQLDLNGFDQRCKEMNCVINEEGAPKTWIFSPLDKPATLTFVDNGLNMDYLGQINAGASLDYASSSGHRLTLLGRENTTRGRITVRSGKLRFGETAVFKELSRLVVCGTGTAEILTDALNKSMLMLEVSGSAKLDIAENVELKVYAAQRDGVFLAPGTYTKQTDSFIKGNGSLTVLRDAFLPVKGLTHTYKGGADADFFSAESWEGGVLPDFTGGTAVLRFVQPAFSSLTLPRSIHVWGLEIVKDADFTLQGSEGAQIMLGQGGMIVTNTLSNAAIATNTFDIPIVLTALPQTWEAGSTNVCLSFRQPLSGPESSSSCLFEAKGSVLLYGDNAQLYTPLVFTNLNIYYPPRIFHPKGLGAPTRAVTFMGSNPVFQNDYTPFVFTNEVPLRIFSQETYGAALGRNINNSSKADKPLYLKGAVTFFNPLNTSQLNFYSQGHVHFTGGICQEPAERAAVAFRMIGGDNWIEDTPVRFSQPFVIDYASVLNMAATGNVWPVLNYYVAQIKCQKENVLSAEGDLKAGLEHNVYFRIPAGSLDLNGYNQLTKRFYTGWDPASERQLTSGRPCDGYTIVKSGTPAQLEIASPEDDVLVALFEGAAGIHFSGAGSLTLTNRLSSTCGTLQVSNGRLVFMKGAGWTQTTNVVISGGTFYVGPYAGATAFGEAQDKSRASLTVSGTGRLEIAQGERASVYALTAKDDAARVKWFSPGLYGGMDCADPAAVKVPFLAGKGTLKVLSTLKPSTFIIIK